MKTNALEMVNLSVRLYACHRDLVERAAALVPGRTPSDYVREFLPMQAALDLGEELPETPPITRGQHGSLVAQAAAKLGMSIDDFKRAALREAAAQALSANAIDNRPASVPPPRRPESGFFASQKPTTGGTYPAARKRAGGGR